MTRAPSLDRRVVDDLLGPLRAALEAHEVSYPGDRPDRQPAHTVYGGAHLFRRDASAKLGRIALAYLDEYAPSPAALAGLASSDADFDAVYHRVRDKLEREPVEDFRIDFEDGFGFRPDAEEDEAAIAAAEETAAGLAGGSLPPFVGIRIKPLSLELTSRALRTLDLYVTTLVERSDGVLPDGFVVTLPKVVRSEQVAALATAMSELESVLSIDRGALELEIMIETPQSIFGTAEGATGRIPLADFVAAGQGRCTGAHFGVYDYTAGTSITAEYQTMDHGVCDFARQVMLVALAQTGIRLSDGATNVLPVPVHRAEEGTTLDERQRRENREAIHAAWRRHYDDVRHSLVNGYYQGWDLHPAQLVTRYAALYAFFLESLESAATRLRRFVGRAAQATLTGDVFDDAATGQGLLTYFLRGLSCGALTEEEALSTGLTMAEIRTRSFAKIIEGRRDTSP
ncbi:MAG: phosphoenolpyruvate kinase [Gemmatimonadetes bacterium]|nr:phosphoenolpyruvate kinase [Gemmatimonadota bacterium]